MPPMNTDADIARWKEAGAARVPSIGPDWHILVILALSKPHLDQLTRFWYLTHWPAEKAQKSLCIHTVSPEPSLPAYTKYRYDEDSVQNLDLKETKASPNKQAANNLHHLQALEHLFLCGTEINNACFILL